MNAETDRPGAIVDAHVHMYVCFDLHRFLTGANRNLLAAAGQLGHAGRAAQVLMLTETARESGFDRLLELADRSDGPEPGSWRIERISEDPGAVSATSAEGKVVIVAGRQVVSLEGLEVLALGTAIKIPDGAPLAELVREINSLDAIPVIPWGVGKWLGRRGEVVRSYVESTAGEAFFLGDILGRPVFWPRSSIFRTAAARGIPVLPGTDPLPLESEASRAGSCGFYIDCDLTSGSPSRVLKDSLRAGRPILPYTRLESPWRFFANQARLRLK